MLAVVFSLLEVLLWLLSGSVLRGVSPVDCLLRVLRRYIGRMGLLVQCVAVFASSMACYSPLRAFRSRDLGCRSLVFNPSKGFSDLKVMLPCGQCIGCRLEKSRQWALRCMHESSMHDENCFITLTYKDEFLPAYRSLDRQAFSLFMKRLRKRFEPQRIRFYSCGEYGEESGRPHYHALLFGFDFPDKVFLRKRGDHSCWRSRALEQLWPFGLSELGSVSFDSAAYVARYVVKKVTGELAEAHYSRVDGSTGEVVQIEREYATMSRRPGIGRNWIDKFKGEVYRDDSVIVNGHHCKPVRYYDDVMAKDEPVLVARLKRKRGRNIDVLEQSPDRLATREVVATAELATFSRESV